MIMQSIIIFLSSLAAVASAIPYPGPGQCVVDLNGTPYTSLSLRKTPCNNQAPLAMLNNGQGLKLLSENQVFGCGYWYTEVGYTTPQGQYLEGWVGSDYVDCNYGSNPPSSQQSCGSWSVKLGGPTNCCGKGYAYTSTSDADMCNSDGSNCVQKCCSPVVYWSCCHPFKPTFWVKGRCMSSLYSGRRF